MTGLTHDPEHSARGVARLIDRYAKPRNKALLASWLGELQQAEDALWQLLVERSLASAEGDQLDVLGAIVGQPREGRDDESYRLWISARTMVLRSSGTTTEMLAIARTLIAETDTVRLEEYFPAAFLMRFSGSFTLTLGYQIAYMLHQAKAAGVLFQATWPLSATSFHFAPGDAPVLGSARGFDAGVWSAVGDGSYNPPPPSEAELPAGLLVIQGVPLMLEGDYLVITPPSAAPPLVARSVQLVPRAAPAPRTAGVIELADAFSDASLEMDAEGDQFRVALALQGALEDVQADVIAIDTDLTALEAELGAMRFPFTLRTTSVSSTDYEEIGVQRFDPTDLAGRSLQLVAELDVAAFGQLAELQLVDLADGAEVATLSTDKTATTLCSAALVLPSAETLYSVRLRRVGGNASLRVACRSVALELTDA
jgi:hypothetical protein